MGQYKQIIIGISGKVGSGKNTIAEHISNNVGKACKLYSFADKLKTDVCINLLGLQHKQCFGTQEDKESLTNLKWENMPGVVSTKLVEDLELDIQKLTDVGLIVHEPGYMSAREVMQYVGTEIFRKMYENIWVDALIRQIKKDRPAVAIITDVRFLSEVNGLKTIGAHLWRLTRNPAKLTHESETELDSFAEWNFFLDNKDMSVETQNNWAWREYQHISPFEKSTYQYNDDTIDESTE